MKIDGVQITSVRKTGFTIYEFVTRDTEKCPLSVLTGVRIKRVNFREIYELLNETVRIKRVSVERGSTIQAEWQASMRCGKRDIRL